MYIQIISTQLYTGGWGGVQSIIGLMEPYLSIKITKYLNSLTWKLISALLAKDNLQDFSIKGSSLYSLQKAGDLISPLNKPSSLDDKLNF